MDRVPTLKSMNSKSGGKSGEINEHTISILHQNICSLRQKTTELEVWLNTELNQVNVRYDKFRKMKITERGLQGQSDHQGSKNRRLYMKRWTTD